MTEPQTTEAEAREMAIRVLARRMARSNDIHEDDAAEAIRRLEARCLIELEPIYAD